MFATTTANKSGSGLSPAKWILANVIAFPVGFLLFLLTTEKLVGHENMATAFWGHFAGLMIFGAWMAFVHWLVLRRPGISAGKWILSGAIGFVLVLAVIWPLYLTKVWPAEGPVEPLVITITSSFFYGLMLFLLFRRHIQGIGKFFLWWVVGVIAGVVVSGVSMIFIVSKLGFPFFIEMAFFTIIIGAVAGFVSSNSARGLVVKEVASHRDTTEK